MNILMFQKGTVFSLLFHTSREFLYDLQLKEKKVEGIKSTSPTESYLVQARKEMEVRENGITYLLMFNSDFLCSYLRPCEHWKNKDFAIVWLFLGQAPSKMNPNI